MTEKPDAPQGDGGSTPPPPPPPPPPDPPPGNGEGNGGGMQPHPQLDWVDAQQQMLKGMDPAAKVEYFQMESAQQNQMVQDWHQEHFGMPTSTKMPHT
jgi:hypothetical protein